MPDVDAGTRPSRPWLLTVILVVCVAAALAAPLEAGGQRQLDAMTERALVAFAVTRGLNAAISVAQGTELALQPAGVGITLTVGELLDPVNDLVERLSWVLLVSASALGVQSVLLQVGASPVVGGLLLLAGGALLLCLHRARWRRFRTPAWRLLLIVLFVRLCLPVTAVVSERFAESFLEQRRAAAQQQLEHTRAEVSELERDSRAAAPAAERSLLESAVEFLDEQSSRLQIPARLEALERRVELAVSSAIDLIVVFLLQTVVVPLLTVWLLWRLAIGAPLPRWPAADADGS